MNKNADILSKASNRLNRKIYMVETENETTIYNFKNENKILKPQLSSVLRRNNFSIKYNFTK